MTSDSGSSFPVEGKASKEDEDSVELLSTSRLISGLMTSEEFLSICTLYAHSMTYMYLLDRRRFALNVTLQRSTALVNL